MYETVQIRCGKCSARLEVAEKLIGKSIKCPKCQATFEATAEPDVWTCPGCFRELPAEPANGLCWDCDQKAKAARIDREIGSVNRELKSIDRHVADSSRSLGFAGTNAGNWGTFIGILGFLTFGCALLAAFVIATTAEDGDQSANVVALVVGVSGVIQGMLLFALASGLSGISAICQHLRSRD